MKAIFVNGSPRKEWNTAQVLEAARRGAEAAGAETELIQLCDKNFKGCMSCFACKVKGSKTNGVCAWNDDLKPVLEIIMDADVLVIGSPIYFGNLSAMTLALYERVMFPVLNYKMPEDGKRPRTLPKEKKTALLMTMNCPEPTLDMVGYREKFDGVAKSLAGMLGDGEGHTLYVCNTWQFTDYEKYDVNMFDVADRKRQREEVFPEDLKKAFELGKALCTE